MSQKQLHFFKTQLLLTSDPLDNISKVHPTWDILLKETELPKMEAIKKLDELRKPVPKEIMEKKEFDLVKVDL